MDAFEEGWDDFRPLSGLDDNNTNHKSPCNQWGSISSHSAFDEHATVKMIQL
jgi:hypothetical protein